MKLFTLILVTFSYVHCGVIRIGNAPIICMVGGPGCGKGTQCAKIVDKFGFSHLSIGDLLRAEVAAGTAKGKEYAELMKHGSLLSGEEIVDLLQNAMTKELGTTKGFVIDGFPREKSQGVAFEKSIAPIDLIISLECKLDTLKERIMKRVTESENKRADDNEATIKNRIEIFTKNADEVLNLYPDKTKKIDGERSVDEVFADVSEAISEVLDDKHSIQFYQ